MSQHKFACGCVVVRSVIGEKVWHPCPAHAPARRMAGTTTVLHHDDGSSLLPGFLLGYAISHISHEPAPSMPSVEAFAAGGGEFGGGGASGSYDSGASSDSASSSSDGGSSSPSTSGC